VSLRADTAREWSRRFTRELGRQTTVCFGRARRNVVLVRTTSRGREVRLNEHFADAPAEVRDALLAWLRSGKRARRASDLLDAWIEELARRLGPPRRRSIAIEQEGVAHDLRALALEVLAAEFPVELPRSQVERVTWGRRASRAARRTLQLGSYDPERDVVRVHPVLDQSGVPESFVRYVLFHELLHAVIDRTVRESSPKRRRRAHHPQEFRRREQAYPGFEQAMRWQAEHLSELFRSARSGKPMRTRAALPAVSRAWKAAQGWLFPDELPG